MDFGGITGKIEGNADKIGMVVGALMYSGGVHGGDPIAGFMDIFNGLMTKPHIPDFGHVAQNLMGGDMSGTFKVGVGAAIVGYLLKEIDVIPQSAKIGNAVMKAGVGAAEASAVLTILNFAGNAT